MNSEARPDDRTPAKPAGPLRAQLSALLPELRGFARFLAGSRGEADDLVQDALLRALGALDQFQAGTNLRAWVFTILRRTFYEQQRRRQIEQRVLAAQNHVDTGHAPAQQGRSEVADLQRQLQRLPPLLREALVLVGAQGLDYEEAAAVCSVPVGTMKARVSRARRQLAEAYAEQAGETQLKTEV